MSAIAALFPVVQNRIKDSGRNLNNSNLIELIERNYPDAVKMCGKIAELVKGRNPYETARNTWIFMRKWIPYKKDDPEMQIVRMPNVFFTTRSGDCKSYALSAAAIMKAAHPELKTGFRYAGYTLGATKPTHVYCVCDWSGREIIIDCCYPFFDKQKSPTFVKTHYMDAVVLSGFDDTDLRYQIAKDRLVKAKLGKALIDRGDVERGSRLLVDAKHYRTDLCADALCDSLGKLSPAEREARKAHTKEELKKVGHVGVKVALIPARAAVAALILLNYHGLANKILRLKEKGKFKPIGDLWFKFGGNPEKLLKDAQRGSHEKPFFLGSKKAKAKYEKAMAGLEFVELLPHLPKLIHLRNEVDREIWNGMKPKLFGKDKPLADWNEEEDAEDLGIAPAVGVMLATALPVLTGLLHGMAKEFGSVPNSETDMNELVSAGLNLVATGKQVNGDIDLAVEDAGQFLSDFVADTPGSSGAPAAGSDGKYNADLWSKIGSSLAPLAGKLLGKLRDKFASKGKFAEKLAKGGEQAAEDYVTGNYLRTSGAKDALQKTSDIMEWLKDNLLLVGLGGFVLYKAIK